MGERAFPSGDTADELIGRRVAERYKIVALLGGGGMGSVYQAVDEQTGKHIAIKRMRRAGKEIANNALFLEREYHTLARLNHSCIIKVFDYGFDGDAPYYTMELVHGKDLRELAPVGYRDACRYLRDVASSLALLHARRLLHRDISATNVRIDAGGRAKLIDFGALASFGISTEVIGTPPYIAPEALRRETLDQRTDLYALGALAYYTLTRRHAHPARQIALLPEFWRMPLAGPRQRKPEIPQELEDLVLGLLELDPMKRIGSAAWVIDRLTGIGELEPEAELQSREAYLQSAAMVGREVELRRLGQRLQQAASGKTRVALIHGAVGVGKSRLVSELALLAQLQGIAVVRVGADIRGTPYGVAKKLAIGLLDAKADTALHAIEPFAATIAHVLPELWERMPRRPLENLPVEPGEGRARIQRALQEWFGAVSNSVPVLLCVDNVEHVDDNSLAFVAALGRAQEMQKLMVVVTLGAHSVRAQHIASLLAPELDVRLRGLSSDCMLELVHSLFGNVTGAGIVAKRLHELSAGNPRHSIELARHLVSKGIIAYSEGAWVLPTELSGDDLPVGVEGALNARLDALSEQARELAENLSVSRTPLTLPQCRLLDGEDRRSGALYAALDELIAADVLSSPGGTYYFSLEVARESLFRRLSDSRRRTLHKRLGEALLAQSDATNDQRLEAGWQLLHAGETGRGADLLVAATHAIKNERDQVPEVNAALEAALEVYEREERPPFDCLAVRCELMTSAFYLDRNLATKYGEKTLELGLEYVGVKAAQTWARWIGMRLAYLLCTLWASLRHRLIYRRTKEEFVKIYGEVMTSWMVSIGIASICVDPVTCKRLSAKIKPLAAFGALTLGALVERIGRRMLLQTEGDEVAAQALAHSDLAGLSPDAGVPGIPSEVRRRMSGGEYYGLGMLQIYRADATALDTAAKLDALGMRTYDMIAAQIRMLHHAYRGEALLASEQRERFETLAVQGGSTWQTEICVPANMIIAYSLTGDLVGLKRARHLLKQVAREVPSMAVFVLKAEIWLSVLRGRYGKALELFAQIEPFIEPRARVGWMVARHAQLVALNCLGRHREALELGAEYVALLRREDGAYPVLYLHVVRELAHAKAGLGDLRAAILDIEAKLAEITASEQPLLLFLLHEDRARLALLARDAAAFDEHIERMRFWAGVTQNSMLLVRVEAAFKRGRRSGLGEEAANDPLARDEHHTAIFSQLGACSTQGDRAKRALSLLLEHACLDRGWLFSRFGDGWAVTAAQGIPPEAADAIAGDVQAYASSLIGDDELDLDTATQSGNTPTSGASTGGWAVKLASGMENVRPVGFHVFSPGGIELVAVAVLVLEEGAELQLSTSYVDTLAKALHTIAAGGGEVQTVPAVPTPGRGFA